MKWWVVSAEGWGLVSLGQIAPFRSPDAWNSFCGFSLLVIGREGSNLKVYSTAFPVSLGLAAV